MESRAVTPTQEASGAPARRERVHWRLLDERLSRWLDLPEPPLDAWLASGAARPVKSGAHRVVYRVDLPQRTIYLKHYRARRWVDVLRHLFRASSSERESRRALEISRRAVPTVRPLAVGETRRAGIIADSFLITEGAPRSCTVLDFAEQVLPGYDAREQRRWRAKLARDLARFTANAHQAGIIHDDYHTGNLLVQLDDCGRPLCGEEGSTRLLMIDVPNVQFSGSLGWRRSRQGLAMLAAGTERVAGEFERRRFWAAYARRQRALFRYGLTPRRALDELNAAERAFRAKRLRSRERRVWGDNRDYYHVASRQGRAYAVADVARETLIGMLDAARQLVAANQSSPVKLGHRSVVLASEVHTAQGSVEVALKRSRETGLRAWASRFRGRRAERHWRLGHALLARGIATARPLVCIVPRRWWPVADSYLLTEWLAGGCDLHATCRALAEAAPHARRRQADAIARQAGEIIGRLHAEGFSHRDLKFGNLVVAEEGAAPRVLLIDLDGVRRPWRLGPRRRAKDLSRLAAGLRLHGWVSRTTCLRWLRAYLAAQPTPVAWKPLARAILRASGQYERKARRQRRALG